MIYRYDYIVVAEIHIWFLLVRWLSDGSQGIARVLHIKGHTLSFWENTIPLAEELWRKGHVKWCCIHVIREHFFLSKLFPPYAWGWVTGTIVMISLSKLHFVVKFHPLVDSFWQVFFMNSHTSKWWFQTDFLKNRSTKQIDWFPVHASNNQISSLSVLSHVFSLEAPVACCAFQ